MWYRFGFFTKRANVKPAALLIFTLVLWCTAVDIYSTVNHMVSLCLWTFGGQSSASFSKNPASLLDNDML